jgi:hypothetical protein
MMNMMAKLGVAAVALTTVMGAQAQSTSIVGPGGQVAVFTVLESTGELSFSSGTGIATNGTTPPNQSVLVSNLAFDLAGKKIYGSLNGGTPVAMWTIPDVPSNQSPVLTDVPSALTSEGYAAFIASLNGPRATTPIVSFNTDTAAYTVETPAELTLTPELLASLGLVSDVPEPSTWALLGLGLVGISLVRRQSR